MVLDLYLIGEHHFEIQGVISSELGVFVVAAHGTRHLSWVETQRQLPSYSFDSGDVEED